MRWLRALLWLQCSLTSPSVQCHPSPLPQVLFLRAVANQPPTCTSPPHLPLPRKPDLSQCGVTSTMCYWMRDTNCKTVWIESFFASNNNKKKTIQKHPYLHGCGYTKKCGQIHIYLLYIFLIRGREASWEGVKGSFSFHLNCFNLYQEDELICYLCY